MECHLAEAEFALLAFSSLFSVINPIVAGAVNRISEDVDMVTVRFNYRFNWGGPPVAARY